MSYAVRRPEGEQPREKAYLDALQRIVDGAPQTAAARELQAQGQLRICQAHVALEAGRSSRTPISGDGARWPRVRDEIERAKNHEEGSSRIGYDPERREARHDVAALKAANVRLRKRCRILEAERDLALSRSAALVAIVKELRNARTAAPRLDPDQRLAARRAAEARVTSS